jgi:hypothetical protein
MNNASFLVKTDHVACFSRFFYFQIIMQADRNQATIHE